jgi:hypothetical protein
VAAAAAVPAGLHLPAAAAAALQLAPAAAGLLAAAAAAFKLVALLAAALPGNSFLAVGFTIAGPTAKLAAWIAAFFAAAGLTAAALLAFNFIAAEARAADCSAAGVEPMDRLGVMLMGWLGGGSTNGCGSGMPNILCHTLVAQSARREESRASGSTAEQQG